MEKIDEFSQHGDFIVNLQSKLLDRQLLLPLVISKNLEKTQTILTFWLKRPFFGRQKYTNGFLGHLKSVRKIRTEGQWRSEGGDRGQTSPGRSDLGAQIGHLGFDDKRPSLCYHTQNALRFRFK